MSLRRCEVCGEIDRPRDPAAACPRCGGQLARRELIAPATGGSPLGEYLTGVRIGLRGVRLMFGSARVLSLALLPTLINLAIVAVLVYWVFAHLSEWLPRFDKPFYSGLDWLRPALRFTVTALADLVALLLVLLVMLPLSTVINAPFHEWISEAVESIVLGRHDPRPLTLGRIWRVTLYPLLQAVVLALIQAGIAVVLFLISFSGVLAPVSTIGSVWLLALTLVDVVIARKSHSVRDRFSLVSADTSAWLGLATPLFFAPFLIALFVPGATLLYLRERSLIARETAPRR